MEDPLLALTREECAEICRAITSFIDKKIKELDDEFYLNENIKKTESLRKKHRDCIKRWQDVRATYCWVDSIVSSSK